MSNHEESLPESLRVIVRDSMLKNITSRLDDLTPPLDLEIEANL